MTTSNIGSEQRDRMGQPPRAQGQTTGESVKEQAKDVMEEAQEQTQEMLASRKEQAVSELGNIAQAFRETGDKLRENEQAAAANAVTQVANQVERLTNYLSNNEVKDLLDEAESLARRNPELFLGGAFALGLLASRFLKSSARRNIGYEMSGYREQRQWPPATTAQSYSNY